MSRTSWSHRGPNDDPPRSADSKVASVELAWKGPSPEHWRRVMGNPPPPGHAGSLSADVADYLAGQRVLTLATASGWGSPHTAMFCYVNDQFTFYVWTRPDNVTTQNID